MDRATQIKIMEAIQAWGDRHGIETCIDDEQELKNSIVGIVDTSQRSERGRG